MTLIGSPDLTAGALEHPQRPQCGDLPELTGIDRTAIDVIRRPATVGWIGEYVMDDERPADIHPLRPSVEVLGGRRFGMSAVDEQELQRRPPAPGHNR